MDDLMKEFNEFIKKIVKNFDLNIPTDHIPENFSISFQSNPENFPLNQIKKLADTFDPFIDIFEENDEVMVFVELHGIEKQEIDLRLINQTKLEVIIHREIKIIDLPCSVNEDTIKATYNNGILQIILERSLFSDKTAIQIE